MTEVTTLGAGTRVVPLEPLTKSAFAPFGFVIEPGEEPKPANGGTALRHDAGNFGSSDRSDACLTVSVFDCEPQRFPLPIRTLERHPHSAQTIAPMQGNGFVAVVCENKPDGNPDLDTIRAFQVGLGQGINYRPGIWHHGIIAWRERGLFFVQSWQNGSRCDCEMVDLPGVIVAD